MCLVFILVRCDLKIESQKQSYFPQHESWETACTIIHRGVLTLRVLAFRWLPRPAEIMPNLTEGNVHWDYTAYLLLLSTSLKQWLSSNHQDKSCQLPIRAGDATAPRRCCHISLSSQPYPDHLSKARYSLTPLWTANLCQSPNSSAPFGIRAHWIASLCTVNSTRLVTGKDCNGNCCTFHLSQEFTTYSVH